MTDLTELRAKMREECTADFFIAETENILALLDLVDSLSDLLERCRDRLDDADESDELWCQVNEALVK